MTVPDWVQDAIFYQIFPDRFAKGDPGIDPPNVNPWDAPPTAKGFWGGDLIGIRDHLDYLIDLGINAIYLNPIFLASSNHRYNTTDYFKIDPKLGDLCSFHALMEFAHKKGIRIVLDGVFNHCGRGFFPFTDILENQNDSPYKDWFHVNSFPVEAYPRGKSTSFEAWWGYPSLPKFNTSSPRVRDYLLSVAKYWIEQGADGWRLDVPNEINDDSFWAQFRQVVRGANPEAYLVGEIWDGNPHWVGDGHFDGLMHYPQREAILALVNKQIDAGSFRDRLHNNLHKYPRENAYAMYTLLGSHDTERILTLFHGDTVKLKLALLLQFALPGAPAIYYGDEIGLTGGKDPECRKTFPWAESQWNHDIRDWTRILCRSRRDSPALRRGDVRFIDGDVGKCLVFLREQKDEIILVICNPEESSQEIAFELNEKVNQSEEIEKIISLGDWSIDYSSSIHVKINGRSAGMARIQPVQP